MANDPTSHSASTLPVDLDQLRELVANLALSGARKEELLDRLRKLHEARDKALAEECRLASERLAALRTARNSDGKRLDDELRGRLEQLHRRRAELDAERAGFEAEGSFLDAACVAAIKRAEGQLEQQRSEARLTRATEELERRLAEWEKTDRSPGKEPPEYRRALQLFEDRRDLLEGELSSWHRMGITSGVAKNIRWLAGLIWTPLGVFLAAVITRFKALKDTPDIFFGLGTFFHSLRNWEFVATSVLPYLGLLLLLVGTLAAMAVGALRTIRRHRRRWVTSIRQRREEKPDQLRDLFESLVPGERARWIGQPLDETQLLGVISRIPIFFFSGVVIYVVAHSYMFVAGGPNHWPKGSALAAGFVLPAIAWYVGVALMAAGGSDTRPQRLLAIAVGSGLLFMGAWAVPHRLGPPLLAASALAAFSLVGVATIQKSLVIELAWLRQSIDRVVENLAAYRTPPTLSAVLRELDAVDEPAIPVSAATSESTGLAPIWASPHIDQELRNRRQRATASIMRMTRRIDALDISRVALEQDLTAANAIVSQIVAAEDEVRRLSVTLEVARANERSRQFHEESAVEESWAVASAVRGRSPVAPSGGSADDLERTGS